MIMKYKQIIPSQGWALIKVLTKKTTESGIIIPDTALEAMKNRAESQKVVLVKSSAPLTGAFDYSNYAGCELIMDHAPMIKVDFEESDTHSTEYGLTRQSNIIGIVSSSLDWE